MLVFTDIDSLRSYTSYFKHRRVNTASNSSKQSYPTELAVVNAASGHSLVISLIANDTGNHEPPNNSFSREIFKRKKCNASVHVAGVTILCMRELQVQSSMIPLKAWQQTEHCEWSLRTVVFAPCQ